MDEFYLRPFNDLPATTQDELMAHAMGHQPYALAVVGVWNYYNGGDRNLGYISLKLASENGSEFAKFLMGIYWFGVDRVKGLCTLLEIARAEGGMSRMSNYRAWLCNMSTVRPFPFQPHTGRICGQTGEGHWAMLDQSDNRQDDPALVTCEYCMVQLQMHLIMNP